MRANGFNRKYELNVSTYQMIILLLYNQKDEWTYGEIAEATKIPPQELKKNLLALTVKSKTHDRVLCKDKEKQLTKETKFTANNDFKSKLIKVKILPVVLKESKQQVQETQQRLDEERKWQMDACIVRVMKARKTLYHRELVSEVQRQLQHRFTPTPEAIKKRIESLIEREYLERSKDDRFVKIITTD